MKNIDQQFEYFAFISYKHEDKKWAKWLQRKLEYYKLPASIRKKDPAIPEKIRPIFRDTTDLELGVLVKKIQDALNSSKFLIVICSPNSAKSIWVSNEVQSFIDSGRADHIIPFIVEGTPNATNLKDECFPKSLRKLAGEQELLGANIHELGRDAAVIKVIARMFDLRFYTLWKRYERKKRSQIIKFVILLFILLSSIFGIYNYIKNQKYKLQDQEYKTQLAISERNLQMLYSTYLESESQYSKSQYSAAFRLCQSTLKTNPNMPDSLHDRYEYILRMSYQKYNSDTLQLVRKYYGEFNLMDWGCMPVLFNPSENRIYLGCSGFSIIEMNTGKKIHSQSQWPSDIKINDSEIITFDDFEVSIYDKNTFEEKSKFSLMRDGLNQKYISSTSNGGMFLTIQDNDIFNIWETQSAKILQSFYNPSSSGSLNYDGRIFATIENERVKLYETSSMNEIPIFTGDYATDLQFDQSGMWLLLYLGKSDQIRILNLSTDEDYSVPSYEYSNHKTDWHSSYNFDGNIYGNKYYISDDGQYLAVGAYIYDMTTGDIIKHLDSPELAQGVYIENDAKKVIQINDDRSIYEYVRNGESLFKKSIGNFDDLLQKDNSSSKFEIVKENGGIKFYRDNQLYGGIKNLYTDIYYISLTTDNQYALISMLNTPTTLFNIKTGLPIEEYPYFSGDGNIGFGVIDTNNIFKFRGLKTVFQYKFIPLEDLLNIQLDN